MKKTLLFAILTVFVMNTATAQQEDRNRDSRRKEMTERMTESMVKRLKLDKETAAWFKPLYAEYSDTLMAVRFQGANTRKDVKKMTDEEALASLEQTFKNDEQTITIKRDYCKRFGEKLNAKQLYMIFAQGGMNMDRRQFQGNRQGNFQRGGFPEGPQGNFGGGGFGGDGPGADF